LLHINARYLISDVTYTAFVPEATIVDEIGAIMFIFIHLSESKP
jgi:hypothetical protein